MFGVSVAAMALLSASAGTQAEPQVAWSPNLNLRSIDDIPKRLRRRGQMAVFASAHGKRGSWYHIEYLILWPTNHGTLVRVTDRPAPYSVKAKQRIIEIVSCTQLFFCTASISQLGV